MLQCKLKLIFHLFFYTYKLITIKFKYFFSIKHYLYRKKREMYESFLKTVDLFSTIDPYEISQISDALKSKKVQKGETVIKQNEEGDVFYILEDGECYAEKVFSEGSDAERVKDYQKGSYFGELALIKNEPRAATIIASTDCKLLSLDRLSFKRLLGPIENLLKRNSEAYIKYIKN